MPGVSDTSLTGDLSFSVLSHSQRTLVNINPQSNQNIKHFIEFDKQGLYNERAGNLTVVFKNKELAVNFKSQMTLIIRATYSNPPAHGCRYMQFDQSEPLSTDTKPIRIVDTVLKDPALYKQWRDCIKTMADRYTHQSDNIHA